jgi:predicted DNA-binding protein (MmcQ/YjbR family)
MTHAERRPGPADAWESALRDHALTFPEVTEDFPWGHRALKVRGKAFLFLAREGDELSLSCKLPESRHVALMLPFAEPTGYGLGRSGWVSAKFGAKDRPPLDVLRAWIGESYRAIAPKKLVAVLGASPAAGAPPAKKPAPKKAAARKPAARKAPARKPAPRAKRTSNAQRR